VLANRSRPMSPLSLVILSTTFALFRIDPQSEIPRAILDRLSGSQSSPEGSSFVSITRTAEEISIVTDAYPEGQEGSPSFWKCIKIQGPLTHDLTGILNNLSSPLKEAKVPIFAISTWDTDYVLVPRDKIDQARGALLSAGWDFISGPISTA